MKLTGWNTYKWSDGTKMWYSNWDQNYPGRIYIIRALEKFTVGAILDPKKGSCVVATTGKAAGFWRNDKCNYGRRFICEMPRNDKTQPVYTTTTLPPGQRCSDKTWAKIGGMCYKVVLEKLLSMSHCIALLWLSLRIVVALCKY